MKAREESGQEVGFPRRKEVHEKNVAKLCTV